MFCMKQINFRRLTLTDRCQIQALFGIEKSYSEIADKLGFHRSTIWREIKRNLYWGYKYCATDAHREALKRRSNCHRTPVVQGALLEYLKERLKEKWSPEQISGRTKLENKFCVSTQTIYNFIHKKSQDLAIFLRGKQRGWGRFSQRKANRNDDRLKIESRAKTIDNRRRVGDWERDLFFTANRKAVLACVERKTRLLKLKIVDVLKAENISRLTTDLIGTSRLPMLSITNDNGSEFADGKNMAVPVYYCKPFKPQQRGTIENTIGLVRSFITRKTDISQFNDSTILEIENLINNRPRKILNFQTPLEAANRKMLR